MMDISKVHRLAPTELALPQRLVKVRPLCTLVTAASQTHWTTRPLIYYGLAGRHVRRLANPTQRLQREDLDLHRCRPQQF